MNKSLSFLSLSLLISAHLYAMESTEEKEELTNSVDTTITSITPIRNISSPDLSLSRSTLESRKKKVNDNSPSHESKPWRITGLVNAFRDSTSIALSEVYYLKGKPDNVTRVAHNIEWGINDTLGKIQIIRDNNKPTLTELPKVDLKSTEEERLNWGRIFQENRRKTADSLLSILRQQQEHTENLKTMIYGAHDNDIKLNEEVLARAYAHLEKARQEGLLYQQNALQESKLYLQEDKTFRRDVYEIKLVKEELIVPSDDEYDDASICQHYLNVSSPHVFIEIKK